MKLIQWMTACFAAGALCSTSAGELLSAKQWSFLPVEGATGTMTKLSDGSYELDKTNDKGVAFFYCGKNEPAIVPGKTYTVSADFKTSDIGLQAYLMLSMSGAAKPRAPFPVSAPKSFLNTFGKILLDFTALEGESNVRIHFCLKGQGKAVVRSIAIEETVLPENLLERPSVEWALRKIEGSAGTMTRNESAWEIQKTGEQGYLAFVPEKDFSIVPGTHYLVRMEIRKLSPGVSATMMISMPGGKRTPYPTVQSEEETGKMELLSYVFTARPDEKLLRPHLIVKGEGKVWIGKLIVKEISEAKMKSLTAAKKVTQHSFRGRELKKCWRPFGTLKTIDAAAYPEFEGGAWSGFICRNLDWNAADVKMVQSRFKASDEGGYLRLDFKSVYKGKEFASSLGASSFPDGEWHDLIFPVSEDPAWKGVITQISLTWVAKGCRIALSGLDALPEMNLIPFAEEASAGKTLKLDLIRPRGEYLFGWKDGKNPGLEIRFLDRNGGILETRSLDVGKKSAEITAPEMTVTALLKVNGKAQGYPFLQLKNLSHLDSPPAYWRGSWIWSQNGFGPDNTNVWFERKIQLENAPEEAFFVASGDDSFELFVNGKRIGGVNDWSKPGRFDVTRELKKGENSIVVRVFNFQAWGGLICELYLSADGKALYFPSDEKWLCHVGGEKLPGKIATPVMLLGKPPVAPWGTRLNYAYVGPVGEIEILKSGLENFTARVLKAPAVKTDKLYFRVVSGNGVEKRIQGMIEPSTADWKAGSTVTVKYCLPEEFVPGAKAYLDADFIRVKNHASAGTLRMGKKTAGHLVSARIEGAGKRAWFVIDGQRYSPFYYDLPGTFRTNPADRDFLVRNAASAGSQVIRFSVDLDDFWTAEDTFDFSGLDRGLEVLSLNAPELKAILIVKCGMPQWWMKENPDDVTAYFGNRPIHPQKDRQALASKKYLRDAAVGIKALIRHLKDSPYSEKVFGMGISEGWNSEWFWSYADALNQPARSGFSKADFATFRSYLREKYKTDAALAKAWNRPGLTFETITMPTPVEQDTGTILSLLDPSKDMPKIDWFEFRNRAVSEAIIALCKVVKDETDGKWLTGAYYGYLIAFSNIYNRLQSVGHLGIEAVARSRYVDMVWGPSFYTWRFMGMNDSPMQAAESFTLHGKLVIVEQDIRTFSENSQYESRNGKLNTVEQSVSGINRAFGMALARGLGTHWMEMYESWFREKVIIDLLAEQQKTYRNLPPVQGTTPAEVCIVSDTKSSYYTKHNAGDGAHLALIGELARRFNETAVPFRHVLLADILQKGLVPPQKFYIITNLLMLTAPERKQLMERFGKEKATVLWLYAPGVFFPENGPSAANIENLLGIGMKMEVRNMAPAIALKEGWGVKSAVNPNISGPWFFPQNGFSEVIGSMSDGAPALVSWEKNGARHYFSTLMYLPPLVLRRIVARAGVHIYNTVCGDPMHIGNDVVFLHAKTGGEKSIILPPDTRMRAIAGPLKGTFVSGQTWNAESGQTYGFLVEKK